jgi:hypothetical protein
MERRVASTYSKNTTTSDITREPQQVNDYKLNEVLSLVENHQKIVNKDLKYLRDIPITEYDLKDAGFTIIKHLNLLDNETIKYLESLDKDDRNKKIGKLQKHRDHRDLSEKMNNEFIRIRKEFVRQNELYKEDILSIKKDALFIIRKRPEVTVIDKDYIFRDKESFSSYFYVNDKEIFIKDGDLVLKGFTKSISDNSDDNLLSYIKDFMILSEKLPRKTLFMRLSMFRDKYINLQLEPNMYRSLDDGLFNMIDYKIDSINKEDLKYVDISHNYINYIIPLISELLE